MTYSWTAGPSQASNAPITATNNAGLISTAATFNVPGDYVVRVRANDASGVTGAGHAQCCWTNGFIKVTVTP